MSLHHLSFILLLLLAITTGVYATGPQMTTPAGSSPSGVDSVPDGNKVTDANQQAPDANVSAIPVGAPLNPEFIASVENKNTALEIGPDEEHGLGALPSPIYRPDVVDMGIGDPEILDFNSTFDLRETGKVSPVRDQDGFGTCWAFASYGSLESFLLPGENRTFSPKNMVNRHGFDYGYDDGGHIYMSTAYLTRWDGPVDEDTDPYPIINWTPSDAYPPVKHVQDVIIYPPRSNRTDTAGIKTGLQRWGAAYIAFYWNNSFYNKSTAAYYQPAAAPNLQPGGGHAVTLIGWNDTFPASFFNETPPGDGAWILKNSWGTGWGDDGFFYVSYYDKYMGSVLVSPNNYKDTAFIAAEPVDNYDQVYLHDPLGQCNEFYIGEPNNGTVATRFTAGEPGILSAIGFYTTDVNTRYRAVIYRNAIKGPIGEEAARLEGNLSWMGYHTVKLPEGSEVPINEGEFFSVVLTLYNTVSDYPVTFEYPIPGYSSNATARPGESYYAVYSEGPFYDVTLWNPNASACVRAYTSSLPVPTPTPTPGILSASFTAKPVTGNQPLNVQFTDTSSGSPDRWFWSFGDGSQSLDQNPEKIYDQAGQYSVSLVVKKGEKIDQVSKRNFITVQNASEPDAV